MLIAIAAAWALPLAAATPTQTLIEAAFQTRHKAQALALIADADRAASALIAADPADHDAAVVRAMALGYRAKLTRSRSDALAALGGFEGLAARDPSDADVVISVGTWHLDSIVDLGGFVAGVAIGAKKGTGFAMTDRAVALGGDRAMYAGLAALLRLAIDPDDRRGHALALKASIGTVRHPLDLIFQRSAVEILVALKSGNDVSTRQLARRLLPFGRLAR